MRRSDTIKDRYINWLNTKGVLKRGDISVSLKRFKTMKGQEIPDQTNRPVWLCDPGGVNLESHVDVVVER